MIFTILTYEAMKTACKKDNIWDYEIARELNVSTSEADFLINKLESEGYLKYGGTDGFRKFYFSTDKLRTIFPMLHSVDITQSTSSRIAENGTLIISNLARNSRLPLLATVNSSGNYQDISILPNLSSTFYKSTEINSIVLTSSSQLIAFIGNVNMFQLLVSTSTSTIPSSL